MGTKLARGCLQLVPWAQCQSNRGQNMTVVQNQGNYKLQLFCGSANFKRGVAEEDPVKYTLM